MVDLIINSGEDLLTRLWNNVISRGVVNRRVDSSRLGLLLSAIASEQNVTISLLQSYMNQFVLSTATDKVMIENMARMFAVRRLSSKAKVVLEFFRIGDDNSTIRIRGGFKVGSTSDSKIAFRTISDAYLYKGTQSVTVMAYSVSSGKKNNVAAGVLNKFESNGFNSKVGVINPEPAFGGYNNESIESLRNRATGFRYNRDGTKYNVQQLLYENGISQGRFLLQEHNDGPGTFLLCVDTSSDAEFEDIQKTIQYRHWAGIKITYVRAMRIHINIYIAINTTGQQDYTPLEKEEIYNLVNTRIRRFFTTFCTVGANLNVSELKSSLYSVLSNYAIDNISLSFDQGIPITNQNTINVPSTYRLFPNKIITDINYVGEYIYNNNEDDDASAYAFEEESW